MNQQETFEQAVADSKQLSARPDNETLLKLYSLYKQATDGDIDEAVKPVMFDFVAQAKYNAWLKLKGIAAEKAMADYIGLVDELKSKG